ncbi:MAG TPA: hypothetical protein VK591_15690 [Xanthobacteraceae bacterium]|nr:hypothetical protein [Xanthobacteraceae bacterium]
MSGMPLGFHGFHAAFLDAVIGIIKTTGILDQTKFALFAVAEAAAAYIDESGLIEGGGKGTLSSLQDMPITLGLTNNTVHGSNKGRLGDTDIECTGAFAGGAAHIRQLIGIAEHGRNGFAEFGPIVRAKYPAARCVDRVGCTADAVADDDRPLARQSFVDGKTPALAKSRRQDKYVAQSVNDRHAALVLKRQNSKSRRIARRNRIDLGLQFAGADHHQHERRVRQSTKCLHQFRRALFRLELSGIEQNLAVRGNAQLGSPARGLFLPLRGRLGEPAHVDRMRTGIKPLRRHAKNFEIGAVGRTREQASGRPGKDPPQRGRFDPPARPIGFAVQQVRVAEEQRGHAAPVERMQQLQMRQPGPTVDMHDIGLP